MQGRLVCGTCGRTFKRHALGNGRCVEWRCGQRASDDCVSIAEGEIKRAVVDALNEALGMRNQITTNLEQALAEATLIAPSATIERAEIASRAMRMRSLLELAELAAGRRGGAAGGGDGAAAPTEPGPACTDPEDFFHRTRYVPEPGVLRDGKVVSFCDDMVVRYLDHITILPHACEVHLKCGLAVWERLREGKGDA